MAKDYAQTKALEALEATGSNRREAALLLRVWAESDDKLKSALVGPFLNNLCALAVQRAMSSSATRRKPGSKRAPEGQHRNASGSNQQERCTDHVEHPQLRTAATGRQCPP